MLRINACLTLDTMAITNAQLGMAKNPRIFESEGFENWYLYNDNYRRQNGVTLLTETPECKEFFWHFRPCTTEYGSSLNSVFLSEIPNLEVFNKRPVWLVRDGLVPLLWFFRNYPKPGAIKSRLLIHEELVSVVPTAWIKHVGSYLTVTNFQEGVLKPKASEPKFLFTGLLMDSIFSLDSVDEQLENLHKEFGPNFKKAEKTLCLFIRHDMFIPEDQSSFQVKFMVKLMQGLGSNVNVISLDELKLVSNWYGFYFQDWNAKRVVSDSFITHMALSRGAKMLDRGRPQVLGKVGRGERFVPLSPYHGMLIKDNVEPVSAKMRPKIDAEIERVMMSNSNQRYPWPRWLVEWSREVRSS
jgi:hypothetical protein